MSKPNTILLLPPEQKRWVDEQLSARVPRRVILAEAAARGISITNGNLGRYAKSPERTQTAAGAAMCDVVERVLRERLRDVADVDVVEAVIRCLTSKNLSCDVCRGLRHGAKR